MTKVKKSSILLTCLLLALLCGVLFYIDGNASKYIIRITRLCAINIVLALSMNLVNGFTGIFSLGHAGFMAIGAYTVALLTIPVAKKETIFMLEPLVAPLNTLTLPFGAALVIGGLLAAALLLVAARHLSPASAAAIGAVTGLVLDLYTGRQVLLTVVFCGATAAAALRRRTRFLPPLHTCC